MRESPIDANVAALTPNSLWTIFFADLLRTEQVMAPILEHLSPELLRLQPSGYFGPAELVVHVGQSAQFATRFIPPQVGMGAPYELRPPFTEIVAIRDPVERRRALSALNLQGARRATSELFSTPEDLCRWWTGQARRVFDALSIIPGSVPVEQWQTVVSHPLVELRAPLLRMCEIMFIRHFWYHFGQLTQQLKCAGRGDLVPFPFGEFLPSGD